MLKILEDLGPEDHFGIVIFDHRVETWEESVRKATKENIAEAMAFVKKINDYGGKQNKNNYMLMTNKSSNPSLFVK